MAKNCASGILASLTYAAFGVDEAYADGRFSFSPFSSSPPAALAAEAEAPEPPKPPSDEPKVRNNNPRTTSAGFDPEALERGVEALKEITSSQHAKKVRSFSFYFSEFEFLMSLFACT